MAAEYDVGASTITDILREKHKWLAIDNESCEASRKRSRKPKWPHLDEAMRVWTEAAFASGLDLSQAALIAKAKRFASRFGYQDFKGDGWVNKFQERVGLRQYTKHMSSNIHPLKVKMSLNLSLIILMKMLLKLSQC